MTNSASPRPLDSALTTAENGQSPETGTAVANYSDTLSCGPGLPMETNERAWGGARNRADRVSYYLTDPQVEKLMRAARNAFEGGRVFQRHWTVHYGLAGIAPNDGARFVGNLLDLVKKQARRDGGEASAIWVRECASRKGEHVHILLHLPDGMSLRNRTRRWIVAAGGTYRAGVSKVTLIGGRLTKVEASSISRANAENVLHYILKAGKVKAGERLGLLRVGEGGAIVGKRCGYTYSNLKGP